jgi:hypothetical protein
MGKDRIAQFIDWIFRGTNMIGLLSDIQAAVDAVKLSAAALDAKQDLVLAKVQELKDLVAAGGGVDQAELAAVLASVSELKTSVESASVKADSVLV